MKPLRPVLSLLLAAMLPLTALAAAPAPSRDARVAHVTAWAERYRTLGRGLPVDERIDAAERAAESDVSDYAVLYRAGDLDGDGGDDFADVRVHEVHGGTAGYSVTTRLEVHRGRDGALLWSAPVPGTYAYFLFAKVGAQGKPGIIAISYDETVYADAFVAGAGAPLLSVQAYDGAGAVVWSLRQAGGGGGTLSGGGGGGTYVDSAGDLVAGGGTDLLIDTAVGGGGGDPTGTVWQESAAVQLGVVDGATGAVRPLGKPFTTASGGVYPEVVGDLDDDGLSDVAMLTPQDDTDVLQAIAAKDGAALWSRPFDEPGNEFIGLPDVTGDGVADMAVVVGGYSITVTPGSMTESASTATVALLDGRTGVTAWSRPGTRMVELGDVDRRKGSEVVVGEYVSNGWTGFRTTAYTGSGKKLWSVTRRLASSYGKERAYSSWSVIGDVHGDGAADIGYSVTATPSTGKERRDEGTIDGRTGRVTPDPVKEMYALKLPIDGRGTDAYTRQVASGALTVGAWRGDAPRRLWQVSVAAAGMATRTFGAYVDADKCADVVVSTADETTTTSYVLAGATGAPLWALAREGEDAPRVSHPKPRSLSRFVRTC